MPRSASPLIVVPGLALAFIFALTGCGKSAVGGDAGLVDGTDGGGDGGTELTWFKDALPIVQTHCLTCHVAGGIAPFTLTTYDSAFLHRSQLVTQVSTGKMPPWLPNDGCQDLKDNRRMSAQEVDVLIRWASGPALAGDFNDAPPDRDAGVLALPWVDLTLDAKADYTPPTTTRPDDYRCFVLDPQLTADRDIIGIDVQPGARRMVHHVVIYSSPMAEALAADNAGPGLGWECYGGPNTANPQLVGGWVPGMAPTLSPEGTGIPIKKGEAMVMQIHYNLVNGISPDRTVVKVQLSKAPVAKQAMMLPLLNNKFVIPPNSASYSATAQYQLPVSATVWGVLPHMHTLGRKLKVEKGNTCLLDIPRWDFNWQQLYWFKKPLTGAPGDYVLVTCNWENPRSTAVRWGEGTADEMCLNYFYVTF